MLIAKNLYKAFEGKNIFSGINFTIDKGEKIVLVGQNGIGKSTLLKILAGHLAADNGEVILSKDVSVGYMPQEIDTTLYKTVMEYARGRLPDTPQKEYEYKLAILFSLFGMPNTKMDTQIQTLSGGQKSKLILSVFLLEPYSLMLLDEPTNNIDLKTIIALELWLSKTKNAIMLISHDIHFLDAIGTKVIEINTDSSIKIQKGKYSSFLKEKEIALQNQREAYQKYQIEKNRLLMIAAKSEKNLDTRSEFLIKSRESDKQVRGLMKEGATSNQRKAKILRKRVDRLEEVDKPFDYKELEIEIPLSDITEDSDLEIKFKNVSLGTENQKIIGPFSLEIISGERVILIGENGIGKTTMLSPLSKNRKDIQVIEGDLTIGKDVSIVNFVQDHENLDKETTILDTFVSLTNINRERAQHKLSLLGFEESFLKLKIGDISSGQRARILLATLSVRAVNTILLDEPTNHLDIEAVQILEKGLQNFKGTIITISHDQDFIQKIKPTKIYEVNKEGIILIENYEKYLSGINIQSQKLIRGLQSKLSNI